MSVSSRVLPFGDRGPGMLSVFCAYTSGWRVCEKKFEWVLAWSIVARASRKASPLVTFPPEPGGLAGFCERDAVLPSWQVPSKECVGEVTGVKADRTGCQCPVVSCCVRVLPVTSLPVCEYRVGYCGRRVTCFSDTVSYSPVMCLHVSVLSRRSSAGLGVCQEGHQYGV